MVKLNHWTREQAEALRTQAEAALDRALAEPAVPEHPKADEELLLSFAHLSLRRLAPLLEGEEPSSMREQIVDVLLEMIRVLTRRP